jgi:DNA-directed RNA polymerase subunit beta'
MGAFDAIRALRIGLASPEHIRSWSHGEITKPETIHYRTHKPIPDGLFCERIFGPVKDWTCSCGKHQYKYRRKYRRKPTDGIVCDECGVELAPATVRRERMGHIELAAPIVHPWYVRDRTISLLLDLSPWQLSAILAYQRYIVILLHEDQRSQELSRLIPEEETETALCTMFARLHPGDLLEVGQYQALSSMFPQIFQAQTGAEAIRSRLEALNLDDLADQLRRQIAEGNDIKKATRRLQVVEAFRASGQNPGWMVFSCIPVLPPELRPLLVLDGGRIVSSDLNELYRRLIHRNNRLKRFLELRAPDIILNNERRLLQQACDALFDNAHSKKRLTNARRQPLKSLTDILQGKEGRFRRNLLGKRVDYSGRSVIVAGPNLSLHECGLPKEMACELFKPFLIRKLLNRKFASNLKKAKRMVEQRDELIWDLLAEVLFERVVILNRAPTLHRLSIQAFQPRLIEGKAIQLHPLVCAAFNADFDGDQMAVHVPISEAAQNEAQRLLQSTRNLRHPASGDPSISPSQEIVLGCFYLTEERPSTKQTKSVFSDPNEALLAHTTGHIDLHTRILVRLKDSSIYEAPPPTEPKTLRSDRVETTVGRLLFNEILPEPLRYRNYPMNKECLKALIAECLTTCGDEETVHLLDQMKRLGYQYATRSGISFAISDVKIPPEREELINRGKKLVEEVDAVYHMGEMTYDEWYRQVVEIWTENTELISGKAKDVLDPFGTIMTIVKSGATKAKFQQIRQLSGIRGLMANPSGKIIPFPVLSNYKLGLLVWEIFIAASGARKGFMDRSLNTAMSGYLTRRLVEAGMEVIVTQIDCHTTEGFLITNEESRRIGLPNMRTRIIGRVLAEHAGNIPAGTLLDEKLADALLASGVEYLRIRSPLSCQASYGVCQQCYGADLATGRLVRPGAAVGVLAGQAIGEPGTQLTMRTFHSGGIANNASDITLGLPRVNDLFEVHAPSQPAPMAKKEGRVKEIETDTNTGSHRIHFTSPSTQDKEEHDEWICDIPFRYRLAIQVGQMIEIGTPLTEGPLNQQEILHLLGQEAAQRYLIQEVQRVYRGTGAVIHDKHLEVIVRQMSRYVQITDGGNTSLLPGEIVDRFRYRQQVAAIVAQGGQPATARPLLFGLTSTALHTISWISAASFQDMSRVLARAAIQNQQDNLTGLKERLVVGKKLPMPKEKA